MQFKHVGSNIMWNRGVSVVAVWKGWKEDEFLLLRTIVLYVVALALLMGAVLCFHDAQVLYEYRSSWMRFHS